MGVKPVVTGRAERDGVTNRLKHKARSVITALDDMGALKLSPTPATKAPIFPEADYLRVESIVRVDLNSSEALGHLLFIYIR